MTSQEIPSLQQRSHGRLLFALCTALVIPLAGCGGGSNNVYQVVAVKATPAPTAAPTPAGSSSATVGSTPSSSSFVTTSGASGTITLPAASSGSATASFQTSTTPPSGVPTLSASAAERRVSDTASAGMLYVSATFASTITLPSLPAFSFSGISTTPNTSYYLAFFDPAAATYAKAIEGPAVVGASGTLAFTAPAGSVTFAAGKTYVFALYGVSFSSLALNAGTLAITGLGSANAATLTAAENAYTGAFSATSANTAIAAVSVSGATITVVPVAAGQTTVTVTDAHGQTATATVTVTLAPVTVDHASLSFTTLGAAGAQTFTPAEAHYGGTFTAASANPAVATVSGPDANGAFTVTAVGGGTTAITVTDANNQTATVNASVTTGTFIPQ